MGCIKMSKLKDKLEELFFDYHIRGCKPGDEISNKICDENKEQTIKEIITLFKQWALELLPEKVDIHWGNGYGAGKNETIDEIRKRIEEE